MKKIKVFTVLIVMKDEDFCDTMDEESFFSYEKAHRCFETYKSRMLNEAINTQEKIKILINNEDMFSYCYADNENNVDVAKIVVTELEIPNYV